MDIGKWYVEKYAKMIRIKIHRNGFSVTYSTLAYSSLRNSEVRTRFRNIVYALIIGIAESG